MLFLPALGWGLILVGLVLFLVDVSVTNHGLLTAAGLVALLTGGLTLLGAGVPYSGAVSVTVSVVAVIMGGVLFSLLGIARSLRDRPVLTGKEGMIGEVGTVRSPVGVESAGWIFVHGERWRALLALAPEETGPGEDGPNVGVGHKVTVVGFGSGGTVRVLPTEDY